MHMNNETKLGLLVLGCLYTITLSILGFVGVAFVEAVVLNSFIWLLIIAAAYQALQHHMKRITPPDGEEG